MSMGWWFLDAFLVIAGYAACWFTKDWVRMVYTSVDTEVEYLKQRIHDLTGK